MQATRGESYTSYMQMMVVQSYDRANLQCLKNLQLFEAALAGSESLFEACIAPKLNSKSYGTHECPVSH